MEQKEEDNDGTIDTDIAKIQILRNEIKKQETKINQLNERLCALESYGSDPFDFTAIEGCKEFIKKEGAKINELQKEIKQIQIELNGLKRQIDNFKFD